MKVLWASLSMLVGAMGCGAVASTPAWTGGGMEATAPERIAAREAELEEEREEDSGPKSIGAQHILVMHADSQQKPAGITRTRAEAKTRAEECLAKLRKGADFKAVVEECSDEPGAVERGGDLGVFERKTMVKAFGDAAFGLEVDEISNLVETPFGFHIIRRTE